MSKQSETMPKHWYSTTATLWANTLRINRIIWEEKRVIFLMLIGVYLLTSVLPTLQAGSTGIIINELIRTNGLKNTPSLIILSTAVLIISTALVPLLSTLAGYLQKLFWIFMEQKLELLILAKNSQIDIARHENPEHNDLFNKVENSGTNRAQNFTEREFFLAENILELIIASIILIASQWWIFILILLTTIPELLVQIQYTNEVWGICHVQGETRSKYIDLRSYFTQIPHLTELKLFNTTSHIYSLAEKLYHGFQNDQKKSENTKLYYQSLAVLVSQMAMGFSMAYFIFQVIHGSVLVGTLAFILVSIGRFRSSLSGLFLSMGRQYEDSLHITDLFTFLDTKSVIPKPHPGIILSTQTAPVISFNNVNFKYPNTPTFILKNFSLAIAPGEKLAIVGINGAGKTTLTKLLCRFYDPTDGTITINGHDLREINLESWYDQLGVILQDYAHYHFPVRDAISIGQITNSPSESKIIAAAESSEADQFITNWPKQYDQMLGKEFKDGIEPSIGQWQKLALARNFYRNPRLLILDEPTSSLDAEAEAKIFERLESLSSDRSLILISHRFSTVRRADQIVILDDGLIKEKGTHEELLTLNGTYARLFALQAQGYK